MPNFKGYFMPEDIYAEFIVACGQTCENCLHREPMGTICGDCHGHSKWMPISPEVES